MKTLQICAVEIVPDGRTTVRVEARQWGTSGPAAAIQGGKAAAGEVAGEERARGWYEEAHRNPLPDPLYMSENDLGRRLRPEGGDSGPPEYPAQRVK